MSIERYRIEEVCNWYPLEYRLSWSVFWKTFPAKKKTNENVVDLNSSILMMSSWEYLFLESVCSFNKYASSWPNTEYLYLKVTVYENERFSDNTCESVSNVENVENSEDLILVTWLKFGDFKCSNSSLEFLGPTSDWSHFSSRLKTLLNMCWPAFCEKNGYTWINRQWIYV